MNHTWHRRRGWLAIAVPVVVLAFGTSIRMLPQSISSPADHSTPRQTAWELASDPIQSSTDGVRPGIPAFVGWRMPSEIYPCPEPGQPAAAIAPTRNPFEDSFHYSPASAERMCAGISISAAGPASNPGLDPALGPPLDRALSYWQQTGSASNRIDPFPDNAQNGAAFWNPVRANAGADAGKVVTLQLRAGTEPATRQVRITIPDALSREESGCRDTPTRAAPSTGGTTAAGDSSVEAIPLDRFFYMRLGPDDRLSGASCGDFAVLMAFHLVHKVQGRWLWSTFWWDPDSAEFGAGRPADFRGAGRFPSAWANYAMDASYEKEGIIFNPWRLEERGDSCARCHTEVAVYQDGNGKALGFDGVMATHFHFR